MIAKHLLDIAAILTTYKQITFFKTLLYVFIPETLYTLLVAAFIFFPVRLLCSAMNKDYLQ
jgi:hypothetical protein